MRQFAARVLKRLVRALDPSIVSVYPPPDPFVDGLCFANAGMLERGNLYCFHYAINHLASESPLIEIVSFCGLSTNLLTHYKATSGRCNRLFTCDEWCFEGAEEINAMIGSSHCTHLAYRSFVYESFKRNTQFFSGKDLPYTIEKSSDAFFAAWRKGEIVTDIFGRSVRLGGPVSFCFVDGNHSCDYVKRDFENCEEFLEGGEFVFFDDSQDDSGWEVRKVVKEIQVSRKYDLVIKNPNYLFVKR
jgi:hypothetical protein